MKIDSVSLKTVAVRMSQYPDDQKPEFLLVGRSNVGKSQDLQGKQILASNEKYYLVDVPGYGYAMVNKDTQKKFGLMIEEYLINRKNLKRVFLLVDYRHKPTEDDLLMFNFMKYYKLDVTIVATKYDKVKQSDRSKVEKVLNESFELGENDNIVYFSSVTRKGKEEILNIIDRCL